MWLKHISKDQKIIPYFILGHTLVVFHEKASIQPLAQCSMRRYGSETKYEMFKAQLVEHCTDNAKVMGSVPVEARF